jgi:hypothetical membrane protein
MNRRQIGALAGMIGSAFFVAVFTIEGLLRPGYDWRSTFISALSLGPRGWIQITNFLVLGTLMLLFTWGVAAEFREGKASRFGPILLAIIGIGFLVSGPLVMDPTGTAVAEMTPHGIAHQLFGAIVFTLAPIVCFVFFRRFRSDPDWRWFAWWTLAAGIVITLAIIALRIMNPQPPALPHPLAGIAQRMIMIPFLAWVFVFGAGLYRRSKRSASQLAST